MERRILIEDDAPVMRRPVADAPAEGEALPVQGELDLAGTSVEAALARLADVFLGEDSDDRQGWSLDQLVWERTRLFAELHQVDPADVLPNLLRFTPWSTELPPSRGWWLVREKPGGEVSVLWFESIGRGFDSDGSWHAVGPTAQDIPSARLGMHSEFTNIEWCGLAEPWPVGYDYTLDAAALEELWARGVMGLKRRALL